MIFLSKKVLFSVVLVTIVILIFLLLRLETNLKWQTMNDVSDQLNIALKNQIEKEKEETLRFALVLSSNEILIKSFEEKDEDLAYSELSKIMNSVKKYTNTLIRTQMITADYKLFARSWDNIYAGMPLDDYREDLSIAQKNRVPHVSIKIGRRLGIIATIPVYKDEKLLGFIEALRFFDSTTSFFQNFGIDMYVLLDYDYYNTAVLLQNNPTLGSYIVANRNFNSFVLKSLTDLDFSILKNEHFVYHDDQILFYSQMRDFKGDDIGMFLFVMPKQNIKYFVSKDEEINFLINFYRKNFYDLIKKDQYLNSIGIDHGEDSVQNLPTSTMDVEELLEIYSKKQLLDIVLEAHNVEKVSGEIK